MKRMLWIAILIADQVLDYIEKRRGDDGGWTGEFDSKKPIDLGLSEPHPFYTKEADDE